MTEASVIILGPFPPFVGGAAINTEQIAALLEQKGGVVVRIPTNKVSGRFEHFRSLKTYYERSLNFLANLLRVIKAKLRHPKGTVYLVPDGGLGVAFFSVYALLSAILFDRIFVHHRSYGYIHRRSIFMLLVVRFLSGKIIHVFHDPIMRGRFTKIYGEKSAHILCSNGAVCDTVPPERIRDVTPPIKVGFLSNLIEDKGFDVVCEAFIRVSRTQVTPVHFLLAGRAVGEKNRRRLKNLVHALGPKLDYRGEVRGPSKQAFYEDCDVFLFPTRFNQEASGNVLYEALSTGCVIVASDWVGIPYVLEGTEHRLVSPSASSADDVVEAIDQLIHGIDFCSIKQAQIRSFYDKRVASEQQTIKLLNSLLNR